MASNMTAWLPQSRSEQTLLEEIFKYCMRLGYSEAEGGASQRRRHRSVSDSLFD